MKRIIPILLFVCLLSLVAFAQSATVIKVNANLRGTANQSGRVVSVLPYGTEVDVVKQAGGWFLVQAREYVGWLHGNTIEYRDSYSVAPAPNYQIAPVRVAEPIKVYQPPAPSTAVTDPPPVTSNTATPPEQVSSSPTAICNDGTISYSLNHSGTCSHHGGVSSWLDGSRPSSTRSSDSAPSSGGTVQVKGYFRKDGTYVRPHTRRAPRRN